MAGPWENWQAPPAAAPAAEAKPWEKFSASSAAQPAPISAPTPAATPSLAMAPVGGLETLLHHITGALATLPSVVAKGGAGAAKLLGADVDPTKVGEDTQNMFTYQPASDSGKAALAAEGAIAKPIAEAVKPVTDKIGQAVDATGAAAPYIRAVGEGAGKALQFAPVAPLTRGIGAAAGAIDTSALSAAERAAIDARAPSGAPVEPPAPTGGAKPVVGTGSDAVETGRSAGFKFTPAGVQSRNPTAEVPSSAGVTPTDRRTIILHNQTKATQLAGEQIGKPDATTLSPKDFDTAKQPHFQTYNETGGAVDAAPRAIDPETGKPYPGRKGSPEFISSLENKLADQTPTKLQPKVATQAQRILNAAQSGNLSGSQMVKDISWLRANGGRSVANMLEDEMEAQLGANSPQLVKFKDARTALAQINTLQDATAGGQINARKLAQIDQKTKGGLLTGNLKVIAQSAAASPQDFGLPSGIAPNTSPISKPTLGSAAKAVGKAVLKTVAPGKFKVTSDAFQNRFGREGTPTEKSYQQTLGRRPEPSRGPFELAAPPGAAGGQPLQRELVLPPGEERFQLQQPEGQIGEAPPPHQLGMQLAQGSGPRPQVELAPPPGNVGVTPVQLGLEVAQGRPLDEQQLHLGPTQGSLEPFQPSLLGHEGTPEGGSRKPKAKRGKPKKD